MLEPIETVTCILGDRHSDLPHLSAFAGNDEVACLFVVKTEGELQAYMAEALAPIRAADSKNRTFSCCRSLSTASLTELSLSKGAQQSCFCGFWGREQS